MFFDKPPLSIDDDGRRAIIKQRIVTGTAEVPEALVGDLFALVPLGRGGKGDKDGTDRTGHGGGTGGGEGGSSRGPSPPSARPPPPPARPQGPGGKGDKKKEPARVPADARELGFWRLSGNAGLEFAKLTGDFNPVHWLPPYARAFGFSNCILHGFATMARAVEGLNKGLFAGDAERLASVEVKFTRPLVLPARVGLYVSGEQVFVGDAPGGRAYLTGSFERRRDHGEQS